MSLDELIATARAVLVDAGMDRERSNLRSALTLLALAHMDTQKGWEEATGEMYTTRMIMDWIRDRLGQDYAANTRETIRRFTLHQFCAGGLVEQNADKPDRPINSPRWNYRLTPSFLDVIHSVDTPEYPERLGEFLNGIDTWRQKQAEIKEMSKVPIELPGGALAMLSPGGQNLLIKDIVEEFCPRFAPGGKVLYIDDADHARKHEQGKLLNAIGVSIPEHGKAPDLVVWMADREWLLLIEACSTHGPIDVTRKQELSTLFHAQAGKLVFVSCFPSRDVMRQYLADLAWETEAWCASDPDHLIHLDGDRFIGPHDYGSITENLSDMSYEAE